MSHLPHVNSYRELVVYKKARELAQEVFRATAKFPKEEMFALTDQVRRSSRSIGAQIAEAWAKRRYEKHFVSKLTDADGEQQETQHWVEVCADCNYLSQQQMRELLQRCEEIGRLLNGMISKSEMFCGELPRILRETTVEYFVTDF